MIKVLSAKPEHLKAYGVLYDDMERCYEIVTLRMQKNNAIVHFKGIEDRNMAENLKGIRLYVTRDQLVEDLTEDEFYQVDLIGLRVQDGVGQILGEVCGFLILVLVICLKCV